LLLNHFFSPKVLTEGGNVAIGADQAQQIDLQVHNRNYIVPILDNLLQSINNAYQQRYNAPLWSPKLLKGREFLSGSSLHFFNTDIPDDEFVRVKPKVGDIDTQVNKEAEGAIEQFLNSITGKVLGPARFIGFQRGNEQFSSLWELTDPPIKVQIDLEFVAYENDKPTAWSQFSHSSNWDDIKAGVKGVFHKFLIQSFSTLTKQDFLLRKMVGRGKARIEQDIPTNDHMLSFAVSSKEGGGLRAKYEPVLDEKGRPLIIDGLPVMKALPAAGYEQDLTKIFQALFGDRVNAATLKKLMPKTWSFTGLLEVMNTILTPEEKQQVVGSFLHKLFAPGAQGLYKNDPQRDVTEKNTAVNLILGSLNIEAPSDLEQMRQEYTANYRMTTEGPIGLDRPTLAEAEVQAQLRKGMPHLRDLKAADFLDLVDEIHDGNGRFKLENIPLNVKVDGFGGRFGKNSDGQPFMGTSRTEPRYKASFVDYHKQKGTTDPEVLGRAQMFDDLFNEMMNAISLVDSKLGPDFLLNKQVTCEVLFLPFATETPEGKLKFVGIHYDKLPEGVQLALVPFHAVEADTGEPVDDPDFINKLLKVGQQGSVMFINNRLVQNEGLDVTEIINILDNVEELKSIVSDTAGKRDKASLALRKEVEEKLMPVKLKLEDAIINDPNIVGKDMLGQDYEGIVINSRFGPIKITSKEQKAVIASKLAAKSAARAEQPRAENKTAVVAVGSAIGHVGHQQLFNYAIQKANEVGGDAYMFIGPAEGKDDPIPPAVKVQTWQQLYPQYAKNISTVAHEGGTLLQKIKHELINPLPGKTPRYDNIIITVGTDRADLANNWSKALMKAVNKFPGYEHVKVMPNVTGRGEAEGGTGMSGTALRNVLKDPNKTPEQQFAKWDQAYNSGNYGAQKLSPDWINHLMDIARKGMGIQQMPQQQKQPVPERLFNALVMDQLYEARQSAQVKLQKAFQREQEKSAAERKRGEEVMAKAKKDAEKKDVKEAQSFGGALANALSRVEPGSKLDKKIRHHNDMVRRFGPEAGTMTSAPDGYYIDKKGFVRLGQGVAEGTAKYKVKVVGQDKKGQYYVSPNTGKKVYKQAKVGDHETPSGEVKAKVKENNMPFGTVTTPPPPAYRPAPQQPTAHDSSWIITPEGKQWLAMAAQELEDAYDYEHNKNDVEIATALSAQQIKKFGPANFEYGTKITSEVSKVMAKVKKKIQGISDSIQQAQDLLDEYLDADPERKAAMDQYIKDEYNISPKDFIKALKKVADGYLDTPMPPQLAQALDIEPKVSEAMLPTSAFVGSKKNKLGTAGQWRNKGPKANKPAKAGDLVGGAAESIHNPGQQAAIAIAKKKEVNEYAIDSSGGEDNVLLKYARMWYTGNDATRLKVEKTLDRMGWEIGPLESEEGGVFVDGERYIGFTPEELTSNVDEDQRLDPKCWKGYKKQGTKMKGGTRVNNCVPVREDVENIMGSLIEQLSRK